MQEAVCYIFTLLEGRVVVIYNLFAVVKEALTFLHTSSNFRKFPRRLYQFEEKKAFLNLVKKI